MLDFSNVTLDLITLHRVGNKHNAVENIFANEIYNLTEDQKNDLLVYCLAPFKSLTDIYRFHHSSDLSLNELNVYCKKIFKRSDTFLSRSIDIVKHLFQQSEHPNIKSGEVFIVYFSNIIYNNQLIDGIGIYKSEKKETFFKVGKRGDKIVFGSQLGINSKKMDKGCLILNCEDEEGLRIFTIDNNNYDSDYWLNKFLSVELVKNDSFFTQQYISLCKQFSSEIIGHEKGKTDSILFVNQSINYLSSNEGFNNDDFLETVFESEELKQRFKQFQVNYEKSNEISIPDNFDVSPIVLSSQKRKIKNEIKLDNLIQIKLPIDNFESNEKYIEKGFDSKKKMYYYKIYFNKEIN